MYKRLIILFINRTVPLDRTRHVEVKNKLDDFEEKVKIMSTKGLTKHLIN